MRHTLHALSPSYKGKKAAVIVECFYLLGGST